jgi:hypothetical protein
MMTGSLLGQLTPSDLFCGEGVVEDSSHDTPGMLYCLKFVNERKSLWL